MLNAVTSVRLNTNNESGDAMSLGIEKTFGPAWKCGYISIQLVIRPSVWIPALRAFASWKQTVSEYTPLQTGHSRWCKTQERGSDSEQRSDCVDLG